MCGVVSIIYGDENKKIGNEACNLLKRLEYRGYDSTGAAFIDKNREIYLRKKVGAPSKVIFDLNIDKFSGKIFIGQVRWATFGAVTDSNSQPHIVNCFRKLGGAHNGNISNTDSLKEFLINSGHKVISDNDGEILVHLIEHFYDLNLKNYFEIENTSNLLNNLNSHYKNYWEFVSCNCNKNLKNLDFQKILFFIDAIRKAQKKINGSYAASIADPDIDGVFAIKAGSSLYAGIGKDEEGEFIVVSSDLTSVLTKTKFLIPLKEGEAIFFTENDYFIFNINENFYIHKPESKRSKLNIQDTALSPRYHFYMEQEIFSSISNIDEVLLYYFIDTDELKIFDYFEENRKSIIEIFSKIINLNNIKKEEDLKNEAQKIFDSKLFDEHYQKYKNLMNKTVIREFLSEEKILLSDILKLRSDYEEKLNFVDKIILWKKKRKIIMFFNYLIYLLLKTYIHKGKIFAVASGTSYHAALTGSYFFNNLTKIPIIALNPGSFRSQFMNCLNENDILILISQSGETKDLVDVVQDVKKNNPKTKIISFVNNENSRIPQELSDFYLPILCGPEIAVAATKSFISQILLFYIISFKIGKIFEGKCEDFLLKKDYNNNQNIKDKNLKTIKDKDDYNKYKEKIVEELLDNNLYKYIEEINLKYNSELKENLIKIKKFISDSLYKTDKDLTEVALKLFLKPSIHILGTSLIGIAKEGALKIREVVLNHTEGYDSAEFKHGPNTILGKNTIFSIGDLGELYNNILNFLKNSVEKIDIENENLSKIRIIEFIKRLLKKGLEEDINFIENFNEEKSNDFEKLFYIYQKEFNIERYFSNYPLIFICSQDERDKRITISQIHTHKIRGADIILIAEKDDELKKAVINPPINAKDYYGKYIEVPEIGDKNLFVFAVSVLLQNLALKMSVMKMKYLNSLHIDNHGVHPDAPKNVSKSITVD